MASTLNFEGWPAGADEVASPHSVKVLQHCQVSPPQGSVPSTILPLSFFGIPWLLFSPNQPLFFYDFPHLTSHFTQNILPSLKHSLSLTLQHFFPLAGNLVIPPQPSKPHLSYSEGDSFSLVIAESVGDFSFLSSHQPRNVQDFHQLVPQLSLSKPVEVQAKHKILAVQITIFPGFGVCMGFALRQVAADGRTFDNFLKSWASICSRAGNKCPHLVMFDQFLPCYDRVLIQDPSGLELIYLKQLSSLNSLPKKEVNRKGSVFYGIVRATFVFGPLDMERIKGWILTRSKSIFGSSTGLYLPPYVVTCAFVWVCWTKTHLTHMGDFLDQPLYFGFNAGGINRLGYSVPSTYIGNCIAFGRSMVKRDQLMGENGIMHAAKAIGETIKELDREVLGKAEKWISDWNVLFGSEPHLVITGSPKVGSYNLDFAWGRPRKVEEISIDTTRAISLCESRDEVGGIEVGFALPNAKMDVLYSIIREGLNILLENKLNLEYSN